eukprot:276443_1
MSNENKKKAPLPSEMNPESKESLPEAPDLKLPEHSNDAANPLQKEFVDDIEVANKKISQFVDQLKKSQYTVVFTGAGVSTNTNRLADFRGDKGLISNRPPLVQMGIAETKMDSIMPTFTHSCIKILADRGFIQKIITSNHDGLHNKTNFPNDDIVDLFGNVYVEKCRKCKSRYTRKTVVSHLYRKCDNNPKCKGKLQREKCDMGNTVNNKYLKKAEEISASSHLSLVLGSSMTIAPFCELPPKAKQYVLVTRQETDYDIGAFLCIHMDVDDFMFGVMKELKLDNKCKQFIYKQIFDWNIIVMLNDMIRFELKSRQSNEGLPFIQSSCIQIVKVKDMELDEEKKQKDGNNKYEIVREYELQKLKDLNWGFEIMKSQFMDVVNKVKDCKIRIEIEWEKGFESENYYNVFENVDWSKVDVTQSMMVELCKIVKYEV